MKIFSALLIRHEGNPPLDPQFRSLWYSYCYPEQEGYLLNKKSSCWWFDKPCRSYDVTLVSWKIKILQEKMKVFFLCQQNLFLKHFSLIVLTFSPHLGTQIFITCHQLTWLGLGLLNNNRHYFQLNPRTVTTIANSRIDEWLLIFNLVSPTCEI